MNTIKVGGYNENLDVVTKFRVGDYDQGRR